MKKTSSTEPWRDPVCGPCACSQLRRAARVMTTFYDQFLEAAGLTITQYAVLVNIARAGSIHRTQLAAQLGMERTTLTRNLQPLEREGLIVESAGEDRRERNLALTATGRKRLKRAFRQWRSAQETFLDSFRPERLEALRELLLSAESVTRLLLQS